MKPILQSILGNSLAPSIIYTVECDSSAQFQCHPFPNRLRYVPVCLDIYRYRVPIASWWLVLRQRDCKIKLQQQLLHWNLVLIWFCLIPSECGDFSPAVCLIRANAVVSDHIYSQLFVNWPSRRRN